VDFSFYRFFSKQNNLHCSTPGLRSSDNSRILLVNIFGPSSFCSSISIPFFYWYNSSHLSWLIISAFRSTYRYNSGSSLMADCLSNSLVNSTGIIPARHSWLTISAFRSSTGTNPVDLSWLTVSAIRPPTGQFQSVPFSRLSRHRIVHWPTPVVIWLTISAIQSQFFIWLIISAIQSPLVNPSSSFG